MINIFIQCRLQSSRLPNKALVKFFGEYIIERLIRIAKNTRFNKRIYLLTGNKKKNLKLKKIANKYKIKIFFGSEENVCNRYFKAIKHFNIRNKDYIMRITADNYLIQPKILDELTRYTDKYEYISFDPVSHFGGELFKTKSFINKIVKKKLSKNTRQHVTVNFRKLKNVKRKKLNRLLFGINHLRKITLDTPKDLMFLKKIEKNQKFQNLNCIKDLKALTNQKQGK